MSKWIQSREARETLIDYITRAVGGESKLSHDHLLTSAITSQTLIRGKEVISEQGLNSIFKMLFFLVFGF